MTTLKEGGRVFCDAGWGFGGAYSHDLLTSKGVGQFELPHEGEPFLLLPPSDSEHYEAWRAVLPPNLLPTLEFFWPGPLHIRIRLPGSGVRLKVSTPWTPLMQELLARNGAVLWHPLDSSDEAALKDGKELSEESREGGRVLQWPEEEARLEPTLLDVTSRPWRMMCEGFVGADELQALLPEPMLLSLERAFPTRAIRTYVPEGKTIVVEANKKEWIPAAIASLRAQVPADAYVRIYLDEYVAHNHFPDDREVRVYGELTDQERVRRRLQAMLERQNRRFGKRVLLIAISELKPGSESFRADLEKLSDGWLKIEEGVEPDLNAVC